MPTLLYICASDRFRNLGVALASAGKKVLMIDLDSQASLTISVGLGPLEMRRTIIGGMIDAPAASAASTGSRDRPKEERELKERISLSDFPSLYDDIQKIAYVQRRSVSELLSSMMEEYRGAHAVELEEYEKVKK